MELLLDTVSNVFGGVMFLTLLASLLVIARGAESISEKAVPPTPLTTTKLAKTVQLEIQDLGRSLKTLREVSMRLDGDGKTTDKLQQRRQQVERELKLQAELTRRAKQQANAESKLENQKDEISQSKDEQTELKNRLVDEQETLFERRKAASRKVFFRALRRDLRPEAVLILRYGRAYVLNKSPQSAGFNTDDFFVIESSRQSTTITPKPHRGTVIAPPSAKKLIQGLKRKFPAGKFKVAIAVWGDTFEEFNIMRDELIHGGYTYRTLPMKPDGVLQFGFVENPLAQ